MTPARNPILILTIIGAILVATAAVLLFTGATRNPIGLGAFFAVSVVAAIDLARAFILVIRDARPRT